MRISDGELLAFASGSILSTAKAGSRMPGLQNPGLDLSLGEVLPRDVYRRDFRRRRWKTDGRDSWKLERRQYFQEPENESWRAFSRGEWEQALRLIDGTGVKLRKLARVSDKHRSHIFRVRVVEEPIMPYLQWELTSLRRRAEMLGRIRVVRSEEIDSLETEEPLPEVVTLGGHTLYRVLYDGQGILKGAVRFVDTRLVARWEGFIKELYRRGENLTSYFERKVAPLPPPRPE